MWVLSAVLGATLPMVSYTKGVYAEQETARVSAAFDELFYSLADKRRLLPAREFDTDTLSFLFEFPRELRKLRPLLVRLLVDICRPSQLPLGPFLRGFYFSGIRPVVVSTPQPALDRRDPGTFRSTRALPRSIAGYRRCRPKGRLFG
jgi:type VI secretion system protein ImpL